MSAFFRGHPQETDLALFAGGESGPFARWRIERHVERCPRCQEITADFFRLPDQLNELADLPVVDWKRMARAIESGVRADAAAGLPARRSGFPPLIRQAGLVAATAIVAVIAVLQFNEAAPEPEMVAAAKIDAPPPAYLVDEALDDIVGEVTTTVDTFPESAEVAAANLHSKAREERQTFASDIAAPAAPPPPPAVLNEAVGRRAAVETQSIAPAAESAEGRLRNDAAARVGAVSALGGVAPATAEQAGAFQPARVAWAQLPVEAINFDDAPVSLSGAYAAFAGAIAKTPSVAALNSSDRAVSGFELTWIVGDGDALATALVGRQGVSIAPGATASSGGDRSWRLPSGILPSRMRIYLSSVSFADGRAWSPTSAQIADEGVATPQGVPQLQSLGYTF